MWRRPRGRYERERAHEGCVTCVDMFSPSTMFVAADRLDVEGMAAGRRSHGVSSGIWV